MSLQDGKSSDRLTDEDILRLTELIFNGSTLASLEHDHPRLAAILTIVRKHAKAAYADDFIQSLPHGYATVIGIGGSELSGGQMQRIALARALVRNPDGLIFDEAMSALDSATEQIVQKNLDTARHGKNTITIAHRLATIKDADKIIVFRDGTVAEEGDPEDFLRRNGAYATMVNTQAIQLVEAITTSKSSSGSSETLERVLSAKSGGRSISDAGFSSPSNQRGFIVDAGMQQGSVQEILPPTRTSTFVRIARPYILWLMLGVIGAVIAGGSYSGDAVIFGYTIGHLRSCQDTSTTKSVGNLAGGVFFMVAVITLLANIMAGSGLGLTAEKVVS